MQKPLLLRPYGAFVVTLVLVVAGVTVFALSRVHGGGDEGTISHIGIEHVNPLTLSLSLHTSDRTWGIVDMGSTSIETVFISVPETWRRREVRGVPLDQVIVDPESFGFVRYSFPPEAIVSFIIPHIPPHLLLHNPSQVPIQLNLTMVNTTTQLVDHNVILIQDSPKEIW